MELKVLNIIGGVVCSLVGIILLNSSNDKFAKYLGILNILVSGINFGLVL